MKWGCEFKDGKLIFPDFQGFNQAISVEFHKDGHGEIEVYYSKKRKSRKIEDYYWGVMIPIQCKEYNLSREMMHEANLYHYAPRVSREIGKESILLYKRTSSKDGAELMMDLREQVQFVLEIQRQEALNGVFIPDPSSEAVNEE
jgi:hypothetical protein